MKGVAVISPQRRTVQLHSAVILLLTCRSFGCKGVVLPGLSVLSLAATPGCFHQQSGDESAPPAQNQIGETKYTSGCTTLAVVLFTQVIPGCGGGSLT